jgi:hypothetical protein
MKIKEPINEDKIPKRVTTYISKNGTNTQDRIIDTRSMEKKRFITG